MNPTTRPPSAAADLRPEITSEEMARVFARARFGAVDQARQLANGVYCCRCANAEALVALVHQADFDAAGVHTASEAHLLQDMVVARTARGRRITVTPCHTDEAIRREWVGREPHGRRRISAWVAAPGVEFAKLTLASPPVRHMLMRRGRCSEKTVWEEAMRLLRDEDPSYIAHLLPYPASLYEPAIADAIKQLPDRLQDYAGEAAAATMSGEREANLGWRPNRHRAVAKPDARRAARAIDTAVNRVRTMHLPVGTEVWVRSWEDETIWPGRVEALELERSSVSIRVGYPTAYRSPRNREVVNPSTYPLGRIIEPRNPLPGKAMFAAREGENVPRRRFDTDPNA